MNHLHIDGDAICGFVTQRKLRDYFGSIVAVQFPFTSGVHTPEIYEIQVQVQLQFGIELIFHVVCIAGEVIAVPQRTGSGFKAHGMADGEVFHV